MSAQDEADLFARVKLEAKLAEAEAELYDWATGQRSWTNEQMNVESGYENRGKTLVEIAQRDAAETQIAILKVQALRLLLEGAAR